MNSKKDETDEKKINWALPLLSGSNLKIVFEECKRLQDAKNSKKSKFIPNLNYARESKPKLLDFSAASSSKSTVHTPDNEVKESKKTLSSKKKNVIQSEGINVFGDMVGESSKISGKNVTVMENIPEDKLQKMINPFGSLNRKALTFEMIYKSSKQHDRKYVPINDLPFGLSTNETFLYDVEKPIKIEEDEDYNRMYFKSAEACSALAVPSCGFFDAQQKKISPETPLIFLLQMPSVLPALLKRMPAYEEEEELTVVDDIGRVISGYPCTVQDIPEGKVGTLQILQSGRMKIKLGECDFFLTNGTETGIQEEALLVDVNATEKSGIIYNLGDITNHVIAIPDFLINGKLDGLLQNYR